MRTGLVMMGILSCVLAGWAAVFDGMEAGGVGRVETNGYVVVRTGGQFQMTDPQGRQWSFEKGELSFVDVKGARIVCGTSNVPVFFNRRTFSGFPGGFVVAVTNYPRAENDEGTPGQVAVDGEAVSWCVGTNRWWRVR